MEPDKKIHLTGNLLGTFGNENIRDYHIKYLEDKILEHKENRNKDITLAPNYYAWLYLITEHTFWLIRNFCFRQTQLEESNLTLLYNEIVTKFCDVTKEIGSFSEEELTRLYNILVKALQIRHALIHNGFPNLLPVSLQKVVQRNKPAATAGGSREKFSELTTKEIVSWYSDPRNFELIKAEFSFISEAISIIPKIPVRF